MITYQHRPIQKKVPFRFVREIDHEYQVQVKVHDMVKPETLIAHGWKQSGFRTFNLAKMFNIEPQKCKGLLQKTTGARVYEGDELAIHEEWGGVRSKVFRSPMNGVFSDYDAYSTKLTLQYLPQEVKVAAGVAGRVISISPNEAIVLLTVVDLIKSTVSFGVDREGSLVEVGYADIPIQENHIEPQHRGRILFGGTSVSLDAMYKALSMGVKAIITGGMNYTDYARLLGSHGRFEDVGISLLLTEGFGNIPIFSKTYDLLRSYENRHVFVHTHADALVIPIPQSEIAASDWGNYQEQAQIVSPPFGILEKGNQVRILSQKFYGEYGIVSRLLPSEGLVDVILASGTVTFPLQELQIILV